MQLGIEESKLTKRSGGIMEYNRTRNEEEEKQLNLMFKDKIRIGIKLTESENSRYTGTVGKYISLLKQHMRGRFCK